MAKKLYYKIGEACKRLDIQPYVLRYWETEFPMLKPDKSSSGQRVYSDKDLATIRRIKELLYDEGYTIAGAKKKLDGEDLSQIESRPVLKAVEAPAEPVEEAPAEEKQAPEPAPKKAQPKKTKAAKAKSKPKPKSADSQQAKRLKTGVQAALDEARELLDFLDSAAPKR